MQHVIGTDLDSNGIQRENTYEMPTYLAGKMAYHLVVIRKTYLELVATEGFQYGATLDGYAFFLGTLLLVLFHTYFKDLYADRTSPGNPVS